MKIYFTASPRGKSGFGKFYKIIYEKISSLGYSHLEHITIKPLNNFYNGKIRDRKRLYNKTINFINIAEIVVLEVSSPSLSMGFVLDRALQLNKPVIALYTRGNDPYFATGITHDRLQVLEYDADTLDSVLTTALAYAEELLTSQFIFSLPSSLHQYLDEKAKAKGLSGAKYLLELIEKDVEK